MKCPKCHVTLERKKVPDKNIYYWQCPRCGYSYGKPKKEEEEQPK